MKKENEKEKEIVEQVAKKMSVFQKSVLNSREASYYLAISLSRLYKLTCYKQIPHFKPDGKRCYFNREELDAWRMRNRIATNEELEGQARMMAKRG